MMLVTCVLITSACEPTHSFSPLDGQFCGNGGQNMVQMPHTEILQNASTMVVNQIWWKPYVRFFSLRLNQLNNTSQPHSTSRLHNTHQLGGTTHHNLEQCINNLHLLASSTTLPNLRVSKNEHVINKSGCVVADNGGWQKFLTVLREWLCVVMYV